jgi:hypothetical protein
MHIAEMTSWEKFLVLYLLPCGICLAVNVIGFLIKREPPDDMLAIAPFIPVANVAYALGCAMILAIIVPHFLFFVLPCLAINRASRSESQSNQGQVKS